MFQSGSSLSKRSYIPIAIFKEIYFRLKTVKNGMKKNTSRLQEACFNNKRNQTIRLVKTAKTGVLKLTTFVLPHTENQTTLVLNNVNVIRN